MKILAGRYVRQQEVGVLGGAIALVVNRSRVGTALRYHSDISGFDINDFVGKGRSPVCSQLVRAIDLLTYFFGFVRHQVMPAAIRAIAQLRKNENTKAIKARSP